MLKIQAFYQTQEDLEKADELYKSVTFILNKLRLKGPNGKKELSQGFKDTKAVSCIRDIAEDLAKSQVTFVSRMKTLWSSLLHSQKQFSNSFENYAVPYEYYQGTIFGGAYYVLAKQKTVDDEHLELMETFVSGYAEALPYFNVFKTALTGDTRPLAPRPSAIAAPKTADTKTLRKQFIQGLNARLVQIDAIDWADATMGFDRAVMKELFWGVEDDKLLKTIIKAIINTWNKLVKAKDSRCLATPSGAANLAIAASIDPWKFSGLTRDTINKFFDDLWVERNARNVYSSVAIGTKNTIRKKALQSDSVQQQNINAVDLELMESLKVRVEELEKDKMQWDADKKEWKAEKKELNAHIQNLENKSGWVDCFDTFLHPSLNAQAIADALKNISSPHLPKSERSYWWVFYVSLLEINWILDSANQNTILQWVNLHFNMSWDWRSEQLFKFTINKKYKIKNSSEWEKLGTIGKYYSELSKRMKNAFVENLEGVLFDRRKFILPDCKSPNGRVTKE